MQQCAQALIESAPFAIVSSDVRGRISEWNPQAERCFGYRRAEILGASAERLFAERFRATYRTLMERAFAAMPAGASPPAAELVAVRADTSEFPAELWLTSWTAFGERFVTSCIRDLSRQAETERRYVSMFQVVADLLAGKVLDGRYLLERLLRKDAFGSLYEALDLEERAPVMVRVVRALREPAHLKVVSPPHHPNAAEILDIGVAELGLPYAVLEPLSGEPVFDRIRRGKVISRSEAIGWGEAVGESLAAAHELGVAHGCLCAAAVFLHNADTSAQTIKVMGYEMDMLLSHGDPLGSGLLADVSPYCAPDARLGGRPSSASDVYSYAVLLAALFSGTLPPSMSGDQLFDWAMVRLPPELAAVGARALSPEPSERPSARVVVDAIRTLPRPSV